MSEIPVRIVDAATRTKLYHLEEFENHA